jgi:hypothetical protein
LYRQHIGRACRDPYREPLLFPTVDPMLRAGSRHARLAAGAESMCLLLAYPDAADFYKSIGMEPFADAFLFGRDR